MAITSISIKNRFTNEVIFTHECEDNSLRTTVKKAIEEKVDLSYADLSSANLRSANLRSANLSYADLSYADLIYADLIYADLRSANLSSANLRSANLSYADLSSANLRSANLRYAIGDGEIVKTLQFERYKLVLIKDIGICFGGCTRKTIEEWMDYDGFDLDEYDKNYLEKVTKPFIKMCMGE